MFSRRTIGPTLSRPPLSTSMVVGQALPTLVHPRICRLSGFISMHNALIHASPLVRSQLANLTLD